MVQTKGYKGSIWGVSHHLCIWSRPRLWLGWRGCAETALLHAHAHVWWHHNIDFVVCLEYILPSEVHSLSSPSGLVLNHPLLQSCISHVTKCERTQTQRKQRQRE